MLIIKLEERHTWQLSISYLCGRPEGIPGSWTETGSDTAVAAWGINQWTYLFLLVVSLLCLLHEYISKYLKMAITTYLSHFTSLQDLFTHLLMDFMCFHIANLFPELLPFAVIFADAQIVQHWPSGTPSGVSLNPSAL